MVIIHKTKKLDVYEAFNYPLKMSKEEGLRAHFSSFGFDMGNPPDKANNTHQWR